MSVGIRRTRSLSIVRIELVVLITALALVAIYATLRYGGLWGETDTYTRAGDLRSVINAGQLIPRGPVYPNGYGYQAIAAFLHAMAGINVSNLQIYGSALLAVWIVIPTWLAYRELIGSTRGATLATTLLLVQPEFLFVILRGTHEKFTRGLMFLCIYLLVRSLRVERHSGRISGLIIAFYLAGFSIISMNSLLSTSFIVALGAAMVLGWCLIKLSKPSFQLARFPISRLLIVVISLLVMGFLVMFYAYPPAQHDLLFIKDFTTQTAETATDVETKATNPYEVVNSGWISLQVYFAVSLANWLLLGASALIWSWQSLRWLFRRWMPRDRRGLVLWSLYGAFVLQGILSIAVDISGAVGGTLQHRIFPSFVMVAAPVLAAALVAWRPRSIWISRMAYSSLALLLGALSVLSIAKATNEPLVSNKWIFVVPGELQALSWANKSLTDRSLWTEQDERVLTAAGIQSDFTPILYRADIYIPSAETSDFLISDVMRARSARMSASLPIEADSFVTYDNGEAQIYHLRPRTPYQR